MVARRLSRYTVTLENVMISTASGPSAMAKKKPETGQIRLAKDVIELARVVGAYHGKDPGDFLSEFLRAELTRQEREILAKRAREVGLADVPTDAPAKLKKGKP